MKKLFNYDKIYLQTSLADLYQKLFAERSTAMQSSIKLKLTKTNKSEDSMSHFFGSPIVPKALYQSVCDLDADVMFFGQLDLSELSKYDIEARLPDEGILYLFLDTASYPYRAITFFSKDTPLYVIEDFNKEVEGFEYLTVPFSVGCEKVSSDAEGTKLFGSPSWDFDCDEELFLQFDPLDNETGFLSEIDGYAFFTFTDEKPTFEKLRFSIDRS